MGSTAQSAAVSPASRGSRGGPVGRSAKIATDDFQKFLLSGAQGNLNLAAVRARAEELRRSIDQIIVALQFHADRVNWSDTLDKFGVLNLQYQQLAEQLRPTLKSHAVHPKAVNQENAPLLPIMLASKELPEMEEEEASLLEKHRLASIGVPVGTQYEHLSSLIDNFNKLVDGLLTQDPANPCSTALFDPKGSIRAGLRQAVAAAAIRTQTSEKAQWDGRQRAAPSAAEDSFLAAALRGEGLPGPMPPAIVLSP